MIRYPLEYSKILNTSKYNTFGWVRKDAAGNPGKRFHQGWDLVAPLGTWVFPVSTGEIVQVQPVEKPGSRYGVSVTLKFEHEGKRYYAFYAHLLDAFVVRGQTITDTRHPIGSVGESGNARGIARDKTHLHFEFRTRESCGTGEDGRIDPVKLLGPPPYDGIFFIDD